MITALSVVAVEAAVLVPVKRFTSAKARLGEVLDAGQRAELARWLADRVIAASRPLPTFVACDDDDVAAWADERGAEVLWSPGLGSTVPSTPGGRRSPARASTTSSSPTATCRWPATSARSPPPATITLVPDRRRDGTNVVALPLAADLPAAYGRGSFVRHLTAAMAHRAARRGAQRPTAGDRRGQPRRPGAPRALDDPAGVAANEPGQPSLTAAARVGRSPGPGLGARRRRPSRTTSSSEPAARSPSGRRRGASSTTSCARTARRARGTPRADLTALVARRQDEQREAARRLAGERAGEVRFLGRVDGELASDRATVERGGRGSSASCSPRSCSATTRGSATGCTPTTATPAGWCATPSSPPATRTSSPSTRLAPHRPAALLLWEADEPNHVEDVSAFVDRKLAALEAHESQFESTMHAADASELDAFRTRIRTRLAELGAPHGLAAAELFAPTHRPLTTRVFASIGVSDARRPRTRHSDDAEHSDGTLT